MNRVGTARLALALVCAVAATALGCDGPDYPDPALEGLELLAVNPNLIVPGSVLVVEGRSFVGPPWGSAYLQLSGSFEGRPVELRAPARFVDYEHLEVSCDDALLAALGAGAGRFTGTAHVEVDSAVDHRKHASAPRPFELELRAALTPELSGAAGGELLFVNDPIQLSAGGLFLTGGEGTTRARVTGCFRRVGQRACVPVQPAEMPVSAASRFDRSRGWFPFGPAIAGIREGSFEGEVRLTNTHRSGEVRESAPVPLRFELTEAAVLEVSPRKVSLGQYIDVRGGGFVGGSGGGITLLELSGTFQPERGSAVLPVHDLFIVPHFVDGHKVRYVVNEEDALGQLVNLRRLSGSFEGELTPIVRYGNEEVRGASVRFSLALGAVKQVVHLIFKPSFVESLRHFGLRAVDARIRQRIVEVMQRDYGTVNLEVRTRPPEDFALYSDVEIAGLDPNGAGLLGYDNTPGKDVDNKRLFDRIGGVNAATQHDGYPGYGGVFIESLFAFSQHPGRFARPVPNADASFDQIFDPFRPDRGGRPVTAADLVGDGVPRLQSGADCPASARPQQIACAVWVLGNLVGTTLSHEVGHSLGLANPFGAGFHNPGDAPNRLMDAGGHRPFAERAELHGQGPARFCTSEYQYLRQILPTAAPTDESARPHCF